MEYSLLISKNHNFKTNTVVNQSKSWVI